MDCKVAGRQKSTPMGPKPELSWVTYDLDGMSPGQVKYAHSRANEYLQKVMFDVKSPVAMKDLIRQQNAVGLLMLQNLLAGYLEQESRSQNGASIQG